MKATEGTIRLGDDLAHILVNGTVERALLYDDLAGWNALKAELGGDPSFAAIVPAKSMLRVALPTVPRSERDLRAMLEVSAPLALRDLLWTHPVPRGDGAMTATFLVRRDWLDPRVSAIRRNLTPTKLLVLTSDHEPLLSGSSRRAPYLPVAILIAATVMCLAAVFAWQITRTPSRQFPVAAGGGQAASKVAPVVAKSAPAEPPTVVTPSATTSGKTELVLIGIAGRLPDDADVLVKTPWGKTTTMRLGDTLLGWKLVSVALDRIALEKDGARDELVLQPPA